MAIEKINFSYPKGTLQSVYDTETVTALELASKTSKKVDECVDIVNGVEQTSIQARAIVDDMQLTQEQFVIENNDARTQLITDNQAFIDTLNNAKTTFETNANNDLVTFQNQLNSSKTNFEADINLSKTTFENSVNTAVSNIIENADTTINTDVINRITELIDDGTIEGLIGGDITAINNNIDTINSNIETIETKNTSLMINVKYPPAPLNPCLVDGVTDDTVSINAIISYINTNGGGVCYIPKGTLMGTEIYYKSNVILMGAGRNVTTLKQINATNKDFVKGIDLNVSFYGIKDLTIDGNYAGQSTFSTGLTMTGYDGFTQNCEIKNCKSYGLMSYGGKRHSIKDNYIHHNKNIGIFIGKDNETITDVFISRNNVEYNDSHGILVGNTITTIATRIIIDSNISNFNGANDVGGGGIWAVTGAMSVVISNNITFGNDGDNIGVQGSAYVLVSNNKTSDADGPAWDKNNSGIAISGASAYVTVTGNQCNNNTACGIIVRGSSVNIGIINNICWNNSQTHAGSWSGIQIDTIAPDTDSGNYIIVEGNRCLDDQATKTQAYGIKVDANADYVIVRDNIVNSNLTGSILNNALASKNVRITDNIGYNPVTALTPPTLTSGAGLTNTFCFPVRVIISGGTISAIYIGGVNVGNSAGMYILQPNEAIQINFSVAPTSWTWIGM